MIPSQASTAAQSTASGLSMQASGCIISMSLRPVMVSSPISVYQSQTPRKWRLEVAAIAIILHPGERPDGGIRSNFSFHVWEIWGSHLHARHVLKKPFWRKVERHPRNVWPLASVEVELSNGEANGIAGSLLCCLPYFHQKLSFPQIFLVTKL